ncbi:MAG: cell division protein FtsH, partial [Calditrichaeota bacterium]|nr:cell division protein FtsH [Calditrichota bacterium]
KVTIIPRGRALGVTHFLPIDENHTYSKDYLETRLCTLLGGRVAEKLIFNHFTTGAGNDIERATEIARKMVTEWGMSEKLGPLAFGKKDEEIFLGREIATHRDYSEKTAQEIDTEIRRIVREAEERTHKLLSANMETLHKLSEALLEREILDASEIQLIMEDKPLPDKALGRHYAQLKTQKNGSTATKEAEAKEAKDAKEEKKSQPKPDSKKPPEQESDENA